MAGIYPSLNNNNNNKVQVKSILSPHTLTPDAPQPILWKYS
jgi:hypothetical protein